jgi:hypothetical protein
MSLDQYTVIVSGERFVLTRGQLESEPGNYFATYFLGEFKEASNNSREMILEKDPLLFTLIQAHLRGYDPFPITDAFTPNYMTKDSALRNLMSDAKYFGLVRLEEAIEAEMVKRSNAGPLGTRIYQYWVSYHMASGLVLHWPHATRQSHKYDKDEPERFNPSKKVRISQEGIQKLEAEFEKVFSTCIHCDTQPGWEMVLMLRKKDTKSKRSRLHYVIESKLVLD